MPSRSDLALAGAAAGALSLTLPQVYYNGVVRQRINSQQSLFYSGGDLHVITVLAPREQGAVLNASVEQLVSKLSASEGKEIYLGRILWPAAISKQIPEDDQIAFRVLLVSQWPSADAFYVFRASVLQGSQSPWSNAWNYGFKRSLQLNLVLPLFLAGLRLKTLLLGQHHDVSTPATLEDVKGTGLDDGYANIMRKRANSIEGDPASHGDPIVIWNWLLPGDKKEQQSDDAYGNRMMEMLAQNGGGVMDLGRAMSLQGEPSREFRRIAAVHYPNRLFFSRMLKSTWMNKTIQGKSPGDSMAMLTIPWRRQSAL